MAQELTCDKCGQTTPHPSRYQMVCNRHIVSEKTGYCQGILRPTAQFTPSPTGPPTWNNPGAGRKDGFTNH